MIFTVAKHQDDNCPISFFSLLSNIGNQMTVKKRVSTDIFATILEPFMSVDDEEYEEIARFDINDEKQLISLLREYVVPHVESYDDQSREILKDSLSYFIKSGDLNLRRLFASYHIPLETPVNTPLFLNTLWLVLFGDAPTQEISLSEYVIDDSQDFINSLYVKGYREKQVVKHHIDALGSNVVSGLEKKSFLGWICGVFR